MVDLRAAFRQLRRQWFRTALLSIIFGAAIAIPTAVFALVDGVLFRALPFYQPSELVFVKPHPSGPSDRSIPSVSWVQVKSWRERRPDIASTVVNSSSAAWYQTPERDYWLASIDEHFFDVLGVRPVIGGFTEPDFDWSPATAGVVTMWPVLITDRVWALRFGRAPEAIGTLIPVSEREGRTFGMRVAGVLPQNFVYPLVGGTPAPDFLTPFPRGQRAGGARNLQFIVRLPQDESRDRLSEEFSRTYQPTSGPAEPHSGARSPNASSSAIDVKAIPLREELVGQSLSIFRGAVAVSFGLLIIALSNVLGLWISEAEGSSDLIIRRSLGARAFDLFLLIGTRAAVVTAIGLGLASLLVPALVVATTALLPQSLPLLKIPQVDTRVAMVAAGISMLAAVLLAGAVTVVSSRRLALQPQRAIRRRPLGMGAVLLTVQASVGVCLTAVATVAGMSWFESWMGSPGYDPSNRFLIEARANGYVNPSGATEQIARGFDLLQRQYPDSHFAASSLQPTFQQGSPRSTLSPISDKAAPEGTSLRSVTSNYFEVLDLAVLDGSLPRPGEWVGTSPMAIVSKAAAATFWPGRSAIGQILYNSVRGAAVEEYSVVAVVEDAKYSELDKPPLNDLYIPDPFSGGQSAMLIVGTSKTNVERRIEPAVHTLKGEGLRVVRALMFKDAMFAVLKHRALPAWLFGLAGIVGLPILALGVVAGAAIAAQRRQSEMAIRRALGANRWQICKNVLKGQWASVGFGTGLGLAGAYVVLRADFLGLGGLNDVTLAGILVPTAVVLIGLVALSILPVSAALAHSQIDAPKR